MLAVLLAYTTHHSSLWMTNLSWFIRDSNLRVLPFNFTTRIPKYKGQNLACRCLHLWLLWTAFTCCCPLSWLPICLWSEVVDPCFIHCHIITQKLFFVVLKHLQTMLWIVDMFLMTCAQMWHPLWTQLFHWQMFMQNGEYTSFWYFQLLCYLLQLKFTLSQNEFVEFFGVFFDNCWIWVTLSWAFSIIFLIYFFF